MNNKEFQELRRTIHQKMMDLIVLQRQHTLETGRPYVISGPMPSPEPGKPCIKCNQIGDHLVAVRRG